MNTTALLAKIRDHYQDIQLLTMHCCTDADPNTIPGMINQRSEILELIAAEQRQLSVPGSARANNSITVKLQQEITTIITAIAMLDKQVETVMRNHMHRLKMDLAMLYNTSNAASAYAAQSRA